jgi:hypothetical protein
MQQKQQHIHEDEKWEGKDMKLKRNWFVLAKEIMEAMV